MIARVIDGSDRFTVAGAVPDVRSALAFLARERVDAILLDINLPGEDGLSLCLRLRNAGGPPVIMVTAKGEDVDRILGLEMGADDYLPKPFNPRELLARIRAVLRRHAAGAGAAAVPGPARVLRFAGWTVDRGARRLTNPEGARVALTSAEFDLLSTFCDHPGRVLSREQLLSHVWGYDHDGGTNVVDVYVSYLRRKLGADAVQTVRGMGYRVPS